MSSVQTPLIGAPGGFHVGRVFLRWYFIERPKELWHAYRAYAAAMMEVFSFVFLLRTLVSPWKNIKDSYPAKGFNLNAMVETLTLNITTRVIGSVIRIIAIIAGIVVQAGLIAGFFVYALVWLMFPLLILLGIPALFVFTF